MHTQEQYQRLDILRQGIKAGNLTQEEYYKIKLEYKEENKARRIKENYIANGNKLPANVIHPRSIARHLYHILDKKCPFCGIEMTEKSKREFQFRPTDYTAEHIIPRSFFFFFGIPGEDDKENITVSCFKCNTTKGRKIDLSNNKIWKQINELLAKKRRELRTGKPEFDYPETKLFCNHATFQGDCAGCLRWKELVV